MPVVTLRSACSALGFLISLLGSVLPNVTVAAQSPSVVVMLGRTGASVAHYSQYGGFSGFTPEDRRIGLTGGFGLQWRLDRRASFTTELSVVPRGQRVQEGWNNEWLNATFIDVAASTDIHLASASRRVRPYVGLGVSVGYRAWCDRDGTYMTLSRRDPPCDEAGGDYGYYFTALSRWDASWEVRTGLRVRVAGGVHAIEVGNSLSFESIGTNMWPGPGGGRYRVLFVRVRTCIHACQLRTPSTP
jgi:hypothetical protein